MPATVDPSRLTFQPPDVGEPGAATPGDAQFQFSALTDPYPVAVLDAPYGLGGTAPPGPEGLQPAAGPDGEAQPDNDACVTQFMQAMSWSQQDECQ